MASTTSRKIENAIDKAADGGFAKKNKKETEEPKEEAAAVPAIKTETANVPEQPKEVKLASHSKFDFVPGDKVILWEDFSQDAIGEFPLKWYTRSKGETVTLNNAPGKWMRMYPGGFLSPTADMIENYTVEFDLIIDFPLNGGYMVPAFGLGFYDRGNKAEVFSYDYRLENQMSISLVPYRSEAHVEFSSWENKNAKFRSDKVKMAAFDKKVGKPVHVAVSVQKERMRMWLDEEKVFDVPASAPYPGNLNQLKFSMNTSNYTDAQIGYYFTNVKIALGAPDLRNKLLTEGKFVTTGIKFDNNSDVIKPESYGVINEIVKALKENSDIKIRITGHTDNIGKAEDNLALSKKRAEAVINILTSEYEIAADRLEADGKGATAPVGDNKTAEGRAMNRRVEFTKM